MKDLFNSIAKDYGTPSYIFDVYNLKNRMTQLKQIAGNSISLCYSIKANPFLIPAMLKLVDKLEVCSPGELDICKYYNVPAEKIIYSGVNKTKEDIHDAFVYKVGIYTCESLLHVQELEQEGALSNTILPVILRLNAGSQFGMSKEDLYSVISHRKNYPHLNILGLHYFAGTQRKKIAEQIKDISIIKNTIIELEDLYNFKTQKIEYGPGLPFPYFTDEDFSDTISPFKSLIPELQNLAAKTELTIEMGRFFVSECGTYLTSVMDTKKNGETNYVILDGGINHLSYLGQIMGMKCPVIDIISDNTASVIEQTLCGSLCTTADVLVRKIKMPLLSNGNILAFRNCGAYSITEGMYLFLSRKMPKVLLLDFNSDNKPVITVARDFVESSTLNRIVK